MVRGSIALALVPTVSGFASMMQKGKKLDPNDITCPVLASLYTAGHLKTDEFGIVERAQLKKAQMEGCGQSEDLAEYQAIGNAAFPAAYKHDQGYRNRCLPVWNSTCYAERLEDEANGVEIREESKRYFNLFEMNGIEEVEHAFSTGVRGGNCNAPDENDPCNGVYPCEALFQKYFVANTDDNGRIYKKEMDQIVCQAMADGDYGGEWAYQQGDVKIPGREDDPHVLWARHTIAKRHFQFHAAMYGWLAGFGRLDENSKLHLTIDDARNMMMEGRLPDNYTIRDWGCVSDIEKCPILPDGNRDLTVVELSYMDLPCDRNMEWWKNSKNGKTTTDDGRCVQDSHCSDPHALCLWNRCTCSKGRNGAQMMFKDGKCTEQPTRMFNGKKCMYRHANSPDSPWTHEESWYPSDKNDTTIMV